jgi:hypothetical protein
MYEAKCRSLENAVLWNLTCKTASIEVRLQSFGVRTAENYNKIVQDTKELEKMHTFKKKLK